MSAKATFIRAEAVRLGQFFFRYREYLFPVLVVSIYAIAPPPNAIFQSVRLEHLKDVLSLAVAAVGIALRVVTVGYARVRHTGKGKRIYAADLVTHGIFSLVRNPLYVGNLLICFAVFLVHANIFVVILGTVSFAAIYVSMVVAEEDYLLDRFGPTYRAYLEAVPRWLPRLTDIRLAAFDVPFDLRRALLREYAIIVGIIAIFAVAQSYEEVMEPNALQSSSVQVFFGGVLLLCGVFLAVMRYLKRTGAFKVGNNPV